MVVTRHKGFFSLTIILLALLIAAAGASALFMRYQTHRIADLTAENEVAKTVVLQAAQAIAQDDAIIEQLRQMNKECIDQRTAALEGARIAAEAIERKQREAYRAALARASEIKDDNVNQVCSTPVPARTVELLVAAATSANKGSDGN
jgi:hypothetical protein